MNCFRWRNKKWNLLSWEVNVEYLRWYNKRWKIVEWNLKRIVVDIFKFSRSLLCSIWSCFLVFFLLPNFLAVGKFFVFLFLHQFHPCFVWKFYCCCFEFHIVMSNERRRDMKCSVRIPSCLQHTILRSIYLNMSWKMCVKLIQKYGSVSWSIYENSPIVTYKWNIFAISTFDYGNLRFHFLFLGPKNNLIDQILLIKPYFMGWYQTVNTGITVLVLDY